MVLLKPVSYQFVFLSQGGGGGGGGGVLPYISDAGARRKISRTPLKGTRIFFYGRVPNSFPHLKGTN